MNLKYSKNAKLIEVNDSLISFILNFCYSNYLVYKKVNFQKFTSCISTTANCKFTICQKLLATLPTSTTKPRRRFGTVAPSTTTRSTRRVSSTQSPSTWAARRPRSWPPTPSWSERETRRPPQPSPESKLITTSSEKCFSTKPLRYFGFLY